jgi:hypothetical protein
MPKNILRKCKRIATMSLQGNNNVSAWANKLPVLQNRLGSNLAASGTLSITTDKKWQADYTWIAKP